jgi:hypothetical protein
VQMSKVMRLCKLKSNKRFDPTVESGGNIRITALQVASSLAHQWNLAWMSQRQVQRVGTLTPNNL